MSDRPTDRKTSNGHISATGRPIHFMFGSVVGFSRSADRMDQLPVGPHPRRRLAAILSKMVAGRHLGKFGMIISLE